MTVKKAKEFLFNQTPADKILDTYKDKDFVEFVTKCGGDVVVYRIYNNGTIGEK